MPRDSFQQELDNLVAGMLDLGRQVEASLENMVGAMERRDAGLAGKELGVDARYTVRTVTNHLVSSGTLCEHICCAITETADSERNEELEATLLEMARAARSVFGEGLDIFRHRDIERARDLQAKDDRVDLLYSEVLNLIVNPFDEHGGAPEWRMRAALMVHYLERIAAHGVSIGGRTVFLVTGEASRILCSNTWTGISAKNSDVPLLVKQ